MIEEVLNYWRTGGPLMPVLAVASFAIWFYFLRVRKEILGIVNVADDFEDRLLENLSRQSRRENLAHYDALPGPIPQAVSTALRASRNEKPDAAYDRCREAYRNRIDRDVLLLSAFTAAAPLLGLLGTVIGMIATFRAVSGQFGNTAVEVSAGISQALVTTQCGLVVAIPGLFGVARIRRLVDQARARWGECRIHIVCLLGESGTSAGSS